MYSYSKKPTGGKSAWGHETDIQLGASEKTYSTFQCSIRNWQSLTPRSKGLKIWQSVGYDMVTPSAPERNTLDIYPQLFYLVRNPINIYYDLLQYCALTVVTKFIIKDIFLHPNHLLSSYCLLIIYLLCTYCPLIVLLFLSTYYPLIVLLLSTYCPLIVLLSSYRPVIVHLPVHSLSTYCPDTPGVTLPCFFF